MKMKIYYLDCVTITRRNNRSKLIVPQLGFTLLAIANELWNAVLNNSSENVLGATEANVQVIVAGPPEERFSVC